MASFICGRFMYLGLPALLPTPSPSVYNIQHLFLIQLHRSKYLCVPTKMLSKLLMIHFFIKQTN